MSAGRPVRKRAKGFANDMLALNRLRVALRIDKNLDPNKVARAVTALDELNEQLAQLTQEVAA